MACRRILLSSYNQPTLPGANEYTFIFDTTNFVNSVVGTLGSAAAISTVGPDRGKGAGKVVEFSVSCTGHDVTVYRACLDGAGAWYTHEDDTITAAATPTRFIWEPLCADWLVYVVAGANAPHTLVTELNLLEA